MSRVRRINPKIEEEIFDAGFNEDADAALTKIFKKKRLPNPVNVIGLQKEHGGALLLQDARPEEALGAIHGARDVELPQKEETLEEEEASQQTHREEEPVEDEIVQITDPRGDPPTYTEEEENARKAAEIQAEVRRKLASPSAWGQKVRMGTTTPQNLSRQHSFGSDGSSLSETDAQLYAGSLLNELGATDTVYEEKVHSDEFAALEAQVGAEDEGVPDDNVETRAPIDDAINNWSNGDFKIEKTNDDGDCLFEAFAYQLRRNGSAFLKYLSEYEEEYGRFPEDEEWPFPAKSDGKQGVSILRRILARAVRANWFPKDAEPSGKNYMDLLSRGVNDGNLYDSQKDYLDHMTTPNLATAREQLGEENYKPRGRFGGRPELLEFQTLFDTKIQIIVASMVGDNTTLKFKGYPPFQVIKDKIYNTENVLTLIFYATTGNRDGASVSASHYEIITLTEKGERKKERELGSLFAYRYDDGKSSAAPARSSGERNIDDCVQFTYPDGSVVRGIIIRGDRGIKIKGLYADSSTGNETLGITPPFSPGDDRLKDWNPTGEELEHFFDCPNRIKEEENRKLDERLQRVNEKIDSMLNKYPSSQKDPLNRYLESIVDLKFKVKSRLGSVGREDERVKKLGTQLLKYKNLVKKYIIRQEGEGKGDEVYDSQLDELVKVWSARKTYRNTMLMVQRQFESNSQIIEEIRTKLQQCIRRKGGKRKRKTKRKRRKKKKSTRRKRRKR